MHSAVLLLLGALVWSAVVYYAVWYYYNCCTVLLCIMYNCTAVLVWYSCNNALERQTNRPPALLSGSRKATKIGYVVLLLYVLLLLRF